MHSMIHVELARTLAAQKPGSPCATANLVRRPTRRWARTHGEDAQRPARRRSWFRQRRAAELGE